MDYLRFLGKSESQIIEYCTELGLSYQVLVTRDPRAATDQLTEKRVIRVSIHNQTLEILVGCFALIPQQM